MIHNGLKWILNTTLKNVTFCRFLGAHELRSGPTNVLALNYWIHFDLYGSIFIFNVRYGRIFIVGFNILPYGI